MTDNSNCIKSLQLIALYNAITLGWDIKYIGNKQIVFSKKIVNLTKLDNDTNKLLYKLVEINNNKYK